MRLKEDVGEGFTDLGINAFKIIRSENRAGEGKAVRVKTARREADDDVALGNITAGKPLIFLDDADDRSGDIEFAIEVDAGHLRSLPTYERAASCRTRLSHPCDHLCDHSRIQFRGSEVIEKKERPSSLHENVIHAVVYHVHTHSPVTSA